MLRACVRTCACGGHTDVCGDQNPIACCALRADTHEFLPFRRTAMIFVRGCPTENASYGETVRETNERTTNVKTYSRHERCTTTGMVIINSWRQYNFSTKIGSAPKAESRKLPLIDTITRTAERAYSVCLLRDYKLRDSRFPIKQFESDVGATTSGLFFKAKIAL